MIKINDNLSISSKEINFKMTKSSGPGGQNINKNSTAVTLEFDILNSISLSKKIKQILFDTSHSYLTKTGKIIIKANNYKSQHKNKTEAVSRFITYFNNVLMTKKKRIDTKPTKSSIEKRLNEKRKKSLKKSLRKKPKYE
tara:strand:- start:45 stop:464 length:420 start_codon:yes stop_codon:yes gene_type:complete